MSATSIDAVMTSPVSTSSSPHACSTFAVRGEIVVSSTALAAIGDSVPVESRGSHHLKGVQGTWTVYATTDA